MLLHRCAEDVLPRLAEPRESVRWRAMGDFVDNAISYTLRQSLTFAHVYWADTHSMRYTRSRKASGSWRTRAASGTARLAGRIAASRPGIRMLERAYFRSMERTPEVARYRKLFGQSKPDVVLSGNHRLPHVTAPILAARSLGIPTAAFVASWDNLTSKGRISAPFDHYLVWSRHMKSELLRFYPSVSPERVHVVGTPQFDAYGDPAMRWSREDFFRLIHASPDRPLICYSGGDEGTCPEDAPHLRLLLEMVRDGRVRGNPQVLLRPSPVDPGARYDSVRRDFPELIYARPAWCHPQGGDWSASVPLPDDVRFLANLTAYADVNVNIASTMTLDFGIHDKPVVNIGYDLSSPPPLRVPLGDLFYTWEHWEPVARLGASRCARSPEELAEYLNQYLENPKLDEQGRRDLVELQVGVPVGQSSRTILNTLQEIVR